MSRHQGEVVETIGRGHGFIRFDLGTAFYHRQMVAGGGLGRFRVGDRVEVEIERDAGNWVVTRFIQRMGRAPAPGDDPSPPAAA